MKRLFTVLFMVLLSAGVQAGGFKWLKVTDQFAATSNVPDTTSNVAYAEADSVNITVVFQDGTPATTLDSVWYNATDAQAITINDQLYFFDTWDDMNGAEGVGEYTVHLKWWNGTGSGFGFEETYTVVQTTGNPESIAQEASLFAFATDEVLINMTELLTVDVTAYDADSLGSYGERLNMAGDTSLYASPNDLWNKVSISGIVLDSSLASTTVIATNLVETTDNHYNGSLFLFQAGDNAWQSRIIIDHVGAGGASGGYITVIPALSTVPSAADAFRIMPWSYVQNVIDGALLANQTLIIDSINAILDSIQNHDNWVAKQADLAIVKDTTQGTKDILDAGVTVTTNNDKTDYILAVDGLDTDSSFINLQTIISAFYAYTTDTAFVQVGLTGRTIETWSIPQASGQTDRDTLFWGIIGNKADTLGGVIYIHDGGSTAWGDADSTRSFIGEPI